MTLNKIPSPGFDLHEAMSQRFYGKASPKPTVTVLPILGARIAVVCPLGVEGWWVPPQGSIRQGETPLNAAFRMMQSKLRMSYEDLTRANTKALYRFTNTLPEGRPDAVKKEHFVIGVKLPTNAQIGLNKDLLARLNFASTAEHLQALLQEVARERPVKHGATMQAIVAANALKLLPWSVTMPAQASELVH